MRPSRLPVDFASSAAYPLHAIDIATRRAQVLHFDRDDYRRASFLDGRALGHREVSGWIVTLDDLRAIAPPTDKSPHVLLHLGHLGSTLVSRLLDLVPSVLGLREPLPLLALAHERGHGDFDTWISLARSLLARSLEDGDTVIVKPTSVVTAIAPELLEPAQVHACLLEVDLETWLATMLRDSGLVHDLLATETVRGINPHAMPPAHTDAERIARLWLHEQQRWEALGGRHGSRLMKLGFDAVLDDPAHAVGALAAHYGLDVPADLDTRIADSGLLTRDAKTPGRAYDRGARAAMLADSHARHTQEIAGAMRWFDVAQRQASSFS